jgi:cbb3-type cytochrome oxidase subunit 3
MDSSWLGFWSGLSTVLSVGLFVGVLVWVLSKKRDKDFEEAANLPLMDDHLARPDDKS